MQTSDPKAWKDKFARSGYFFGALLLHLIIFLLVATVVIWKAVPPPSADAEFKAVTVKIPPPPPPVQPPSSGAAAVNPQFEPQPVTLPMVTPRSAITTLKSDFTIDTSKVLNQALNHISQKPAQGTSLNPGAGVDGLGLNEGAGPATPFGSESSSGNQLSGYFYDLKQTPDRKPTGIGLGEYYAALTSYLDHRWDDVMLQHYFKSPAPLYTESFAISLRPSKEAPKAFQVEKEVEPSLWAVHYHGKVLAPSGGDYQFLGYGDNVLVVRIAGENVLDAGFTPLLSQPGLSKSFPFIWTGSYGLDPHGLLKIGAVFHLDEAAPVDMDVLIGDDGGVCGFYLMIMKVGNIYPKLPDGTPRAPLFQLNNGPARHFSSDEEHPPYSASSEPWKGVGN